MQRAAVGGGGGGAWCTPDPAVLARDADRSIRHADRDVTGTWHSQIGQDAMVHALLLHKRNGFFVDLASNEAIFISNTRTLERDHGWNGICIEANPAYHHALVQRRKCQLVACAIADTERVMRFNFKDGGLGGLIGGNLDNKKGGDTADVQTVRFETVLDKMRAPKRLDYLSLDVEGAESLVMASFPWTRYSFNVLTVERPKSKLVKMLRRHNYGFVCQQSFGQRSDSHNGDEIWVHRSTMKHVATADLSVAANANRSTACNGLFALGPQGGTMSYLGLRNGTSGARRRGCGAACSNRILT